jgi:replicative DNA helicase
MSEENQKQKMAAGFMPHSEDAEKGVLSSLLQEPGLIDEFADLPADAFYLPQHRNLFELLRSMHTLGKPVDLVSVTQQLADAGALEEVGGAFWLTDLWGFIPTSANVEYYAGILREKALRRRIIGATQKLQRLVLEDKETAADELLQSVEEQFLSLRNSGGGVDKLQPFAEGLKCAINQIEATYSKRGRTVGLASGLNDFDRMTGGLRGGQLVIVAGRPGMGKTCFIMQLARRFAEQGPLAIFSLEMSMTELCERYICNEASIDLQRVRDGFLNKPDLQKLPGVVSGLSRKPVWIDDTGALSILEFRSRARRAVLRHGAKAIFVDYLQLMKSPSKRAQESRALEVAEISMTLKACAKELNVPVIAACQLNRDADGRASAPRLADLRESGQIEQDADIVAMLHRPKKDSDDEGERESCECVMAKQRNGPVGSFKLRFLGAFARFENLTGKLFSNNDGERQQ